AYMVDQGVHMFFVVDGVPQDRFDDVIYGWGEDAFRIRPDYGKPSVRREIFAFSPDSRHFVYAAKRDEQSLFIYDGAVSGRHKTILNMPASFSPDSQRIAYGAQDENGSQFVVVDWQ